MVGRAYSQLHRQRSHARRESRPLHADSREPWLPILLHVLLESPDVGHDLEGKNTPGCGHEIKKYMQEYGATNFDFYDLTAIVKRDWIIEFCKLLIQENLNITWQLPSGTRSEAIDFEVSSYLFRSGCRIINYAPESGSAEELRRIKKMVKTDRMIDSMRGAHKAGLQMKVNSIFGLPQSSWRDIFATLRFITKLALVGAEDIGAFPFSPYPGSELFERLRASGRVHLDEQYFQSLLAYTDPENSVSYCDGFSSRTLSAINMFAMYYFYALSFFFRPIRLVKLVWGLFSGDNSTKLTMALSAPAGVRKRRSSWPRKRIRTLSSSSRFIGRARFHRAPGAESPHRAGRDWAASG